MKEKEEAEEAEDTPSPHPDSAYRMCYKIANH